MSDERNGDLPLGAPRERMLDPNQARPVPRWLGLVLLGGLFVALGLAATASGQGGLGSLFALVGGAALLVGCIACGVQLGIEAAWERRDR